LKQTRSEWSFSPTKLEREEGMSILKVGYILVLSAVAGSLAAVQIPIETRQFSHAVELEQTSETSANASLGDLDGDSDLDLVLAKGRHWPLHDHVLLNNGRGEFTVVRNLGETPDRTYSAILADLDGDGDLDVLVSNDQPDKKLVYLNDGKANFRVSGNWGDPKWAIRNAAAADLNGDQKPDLIAEPNQYTA
jgi:FG-GAP-like repeat